MHQADLELARLSIRKEGSVIGIGVHAHTKNLSVLSECHLAPQIDVPSEAGRDEIAGLVLYPFDGALKQDRGQNGHHISRVDGNLVPKSTA